MFTGREGRFGPPKTGANDNPGNGLVEGDEGRQPSVVSRPLEAADFPSLGIQEKGPPPIPELRGLPGPLLLDLHG